MSRFSGRGRSRALPAPRILVPAVRPSARTKMTCTLLVNGTRCSAWPYAQRPMTNAAAAGSGPRRSAAPVMPPKTKPTMFFRCGRAAVRVRMPCVGLEARTEGAAAAVCWRGNGRRRRRQKRLARVAPGLGMPPRGTRGAQGGRRCSRCISQGRLTENRQRRKPRRGARAATSASTPRAITAAARRGCASTAGRCASTAVGACSVDGHTNKSINVSGCLPRPAALRRQLGRS